MINSENTWVGKRFEREVLNEVYTRNPIQVITKYIIKDIGVEFDLVSQYKDKTEYIEAKGGEKSNGKGGGALRTDNVKKAIANGALLKSFMPNSKYIIYFSFPPNKNSRSDIMLKTALNAGYVDEVRILQNEYDVSSIEEFFE